MGWQQNWPTLKELCETDGFDAWDHVAAIERHVGRWPDLVVVNATPLDAERVAAYRAEGAEVVAIDPARFRARGTPLLARITRYSRDHLAIHPGQQLWAQIKAVAVLA